MKTNSSPPNLWLTWTLTLTAVWLLIRYTGISARSVSFYTWADVFPVRWQFALNGLLIGAFLGVLSGLVFRLWTNNAWHWGVMTFLGYAIGSPLGFLMAIGLSWVLARLNGIELLAGSSYFLLMPLILTMIFSGFLVALCQLPALQRTFSITWKEKALWLLGFSMSWGIGLIVANIAWGMRYSALAQSMFIGLVVSVLTGTILQFLLATNHRLESV